MNKTPRPISVQVTPSMSSDRDTIGEWIEVKPESMAQWTRTDAQLVIVQYDGGKRDAVLAEPASKVTFVGPEPLVIMPIEEQNMIQVTNQTNAAIDVQVSNYSGNSKAWYTLAPGASDKWTRGTKKLEAVLVRGCGRIVGTYVVAGTHVVVRNVDRGPTVASLDVLSHQTDAKSILFQNASNEPVSVFITKLAGDTGDDAWMSVPPGSIERWSREGPEALVVRHADGSKIGVAVELGTKVVLHPMQTPKATRQNFLRGVGP
ncbi:hypothetical protein GGF31_004870 [Allomyces arbusculus]|nr:hypothetical protein GGF31_004870 [Allomyces arbusculus]